ncbi:hypothetical protein FQN54_008351 [Arachnomyces sp. PD_36]|nr:hypothetical protein FQN54_008351 [Arachnomyces sp. PD_36]
MSDSQESETVKLSSGKTIGLAHYGDLNGPAIFYFHGLPSSRLEGKVWAKAAQTTGAHLIALDRPGVGLSTLQPNRTLLDWPSIVSEAAEHLKIEQFHVLGTSGGGPYALACAKELSPEKLKGVGVVAGMSPVSMGLDGMGFASKFSIFFTQWMPSIGRKLYDWSIIPAAQDEDPAVFRKKVTDGFEALGEKDRELLNDTELTDILVNASREHFKQGNEGLADEWRNFVTDWGFELKDVKLENVRLWCGTEDSICPPELSRKMKDAMSQAKLSELEGETHYSLLAEKSEQILRELLDD